jgi:hypothetical protein
VIPSLSKGGDRPPQFTISHGFPLFQAGKHGMIAASDPFYMALALAFRICYLAPLTICQPEESFFHADDTEECSSVVASLGSDHLCHLKLHA